MKKLAALLYGGCRSLSKQSQFFQPLQGRDFRFFAYGRHALFEAFGLAGVGREDVVLLPEYICRETLSAVNACGARVEYYPVGSNMELAISQDALPKARVVLAVNYFGFPQNLSPFKAYCARTGAILIEDNAHGFLSRDGDGVYLGERGDIGVFSFRKSIPLMNGSGIVVSRPDKTLALHPQLPFVINDEPRLFRIKKVLRQLPRWRLTWLLYALIGLERRIRTLRTGSAFLRSGDEAERILPGSPGPDSKLLEALKSIDVECEISRRRSLYLGIEEAVVRYGGIPVFPHLPENVVPYGFPFYSAPDRIGDIRDMLKRHYLDCYLWPELPSEIEQKNCERYESVWLVNFIW